VFGSDEKNKKIQNLFTIFFIKSEHRKNGRKKPWKSFSQQGFLEEMPQGKKKTKKTRKMINNGKNGLNKGFFTAR